MKEEEEEFETFIDFHITGNKNTIEPTWESFGDRIQTRKEWGIFQPLSSTNLLSTISRQPNGVAAAAVQDV